MKRYKKRDMLQSISMLKKANDAVVKTLHKAQRPDLEEALAQCQETAILLGTYLETQGEEGISLVHMLEDYCENIYQMSQSLQDESACRKISKKIQKQLVQVENGIKFQLPPDRREVVFLPYKASMWDSLESVYLAAKEDENCDAYCIPIPYYDRRPDGSLGMMHYEGNEYPKNIEITDYRTYDLEERHPDAIYIHNPYDGWNHVTCVPEQYFASTLRNYTDELIYIPYFVLDEIEPDDQARIEGMKHFCFTPGVIYAHKVIVQSEKMRQIYINEYIKAAKENGLSGEHTNRKYLEQKILGLGSPKFDKVLNTKKENLDIPEEWLKIIEKPDGSWKKIVFYNTSISALLKYDERMLEKMQEVFRVFKENKDEIALLWRPHPLIKTTIESMRPQLWKKYNRIVERYKSEEWGIYDDSTDMDRAVILSDAYYGDGSSVVQLYKKTNKSIMIQNVHSVKDEKKQMLLCSYRGSFKDEFLILVSQVTNAVLFISKDKERLERIYSLQNERFLEVLSVSFLTIKEKLIIVPYNARDFHVFDLTTGTQQVLEGIISGNEKNIDEKFITTIICNNRVYIIGEKIKRVIELDSVTLNPVVNILYDEIHGLEMAAELILWCDSYLVKENKVILPSRNYGIVLCIDSQTGQMSAYTLSDSISGFSCIYKFDNQVHMIDVEGYEYILDADTYTIERTGLKFNDSYCKCIVIGQKKYYFGTFTGKIFCIENDEMREIAYDHRLCLQQEGMKFQFIQLNEKLIYFQERFSGIVFTLDTETDICRMQEIDVSKYIEECKRNTLEDIITIEYHENPFVALQDFLGFQVHKYL